MFEQTCVLDEQWITKQIHDLIGNSDDPVCKYFDIDTTSGCALLRKEVSCMSDDCCTWVASQGKPRRFDGSHVFKIIAERMRIIFWSTLWRFQEGVPIIRIRKGIAKRLRRKQNATQFLDTIVRLEEKLESNIPEGSDSVSHSSEEGSATYSANSENARSKSSGKAQLWWMLLVPAAILVGVGVYIWKKREILIDGAKAVRAGYEHVDMQDM